MIECLVRNCLWVLDLACSLALKAYHTDSLKHTKNLHLWWVSFLQKKSTILHKWFQLPPSPTSGTHKVKYHAREDRDFQLHVDHLPIDLTLIIPHYRAHNQPVDHKLSMDIRTQSASTKLKVVRLPSSKLDFRPADSISALVSEYVVV